MISLWVSGLITLGCCLIGGGIVCGLFALGMKHGIKDGAQKSRKKANDNE